MAQGKKKRRWVKRVLLLLCVLTAAWLAWSYLAPTLTSQSITRYTPYTVENRDIATALSFGGTVEILHSQAVTVSESTTVREVYVEASQTVSKGDKLIQMENGELLTATTDGVVNQLRAHAGGWAIEGMTLVQICDLTHMQITMNVDEYDITSLSIGQPCTVYMLSLGTSFDTEIAHINRVSTGGGTLAYYTASIEMTVPETVLPGMQASVTIPQSSVESVPALPVEAISYEDGVPFVYTQSGDGYVQTPVALGLNDGEYVQITDGLKAGDVACLSETAEVSHEGFTLEKLYKAVFGETVVINESRGQRGGPANSTLPADGTLPTDGTLPADSTLPTGNTSSIGSGATAGTDSSPSDEVSSADSAAQPAASDAQSSASPVSGSGSAHGGASVPSTVKEE